MNTLFIRCLSKRKDTNFKANHNRYLQFGGELEMFV